MKQNILLNDTQGCFLFKLNGGGGGGGWLVGITADTRMLQAFLRVGYALQVLIRLALVGGG